MNRVLAFLAVVAAAACGPQARSPQLINPSPADLAQPAPDSFKVRFSTSKGVFVVQSFRAWAPQGVDRFYYLANNGFYDGTRFFRVLPNFVVQFGINGDPAVSAVWRTKSITDDSVKQSNLTGYVTYAMGGPNSRTTQLFINKRDNVRLDAMGFAPIGKVIDGMLVVEQLYGGYAESPNQGQIQQQGNAYLERSFPRLDHIISARIVKD